MGAGIYLAPRNGTAFFILIAAISTALIAFRKWKGEPQHSRPS